jgi:8-oxo-dGTP pyrophosphatase MutT (NUDIX family)
MNMDDKKRAAGIFFILKTEDGNKVLILKRATQPFINYWCLPGGKAHIDEPTLNAAIRETVEEVGHFSGKKVGGLSHKHKDLTWTTFFYTIKKPFTPKLSDEHSDYKWIDLKNLDKQNLLPAFKKHIGEYKAFLIKHKYLHEE